MIELRETLFKPFLATCTNLATFSTGTLTPETTTSLNTQVIPRFPVDRTAYSVGRWSPHKRRRLPTDSIVGRDFTVEDPATTPAEAIPEPKATVPNSEQSARMKMDLFGTYRLLGYATANHVSPTIAKIIDLYNSVQANTLALDVAAAGLSHDERKYLRGRLLAKGSYSRVDALLAKLKPRTLIISRTAPIWPEPCLSPRHRFRPWKRAESKTPLRSSYTCAVLRPPPLFLMMYSGRHGRCALNRLVCYGR